MRLAALALSWAAAVPAQGTAAFGAPNEYIVDLWHSADGLPSDAVIDILPSRDGYLWVATRRGPVRFDGARFQSFGSSAHDTTVLCEDREGRIWAGTWGDGVRALTGRGPAHVTSREGLGSDIVLSLSADPAGGIWVGLRDGGLAHVKDGRVKSYRRSEGLPSDTVWALWRDSSGALWIATTLGLARFQDGRLEALASVERHFEAHALGEDVTGALWIGGRGGLRTLRDGRVSTPGAALGAHAFVLSLQASAAGLWIGTDDGLYRLEGDRVRNVPLLDPHANEVVRALREDREGNLWVGTRNGLFRLRRNPFRTYGRASGLANEYVQTVMEDRSGTIWAGTHGGLHRWRNGAWTRYTTAEGLPSDRVYALAEGGQRRIWVGTQKGLAVAQDGRVTRPAFAGALSELSVRAILEDRAGGLWLGTGNSGAWRMERGKLTRVTPLDSLGEAVNAIHQDRQGRVWLGTSAGLYSFLGGRLGPAAGLAGADAGGRFARPVTTIHEDASGTLWIGTHNGLHSVRGGHVVSHRDGDGLPQASLYHIAEDRHGFFWLSSREGLFRVPKKDLEDAPAGRRPRAQRYGRADGMMTNECTGNTQPSGWTAGDGRLLIPTIRGLLELDPGRIPLNAAAPVVLVEQVLADGESLASGSGARLSPGVERIELQYTAPSFAAPEKIRFKYRLDGFDRDWRDAGRERRAVYTSLPPGSYAFRVTACNGDGVCNETGASFAFELLPRFHQTAWFYAVCLASAGVLAGSLHRLRLRHVRARFAAVLAERNRVARELHDTLLQGFTGVVLHLVALARRAEPSPLREELEQVIDQGETCLADARHAVWNLRARALDRRDLSTELEGMARQVTAGTSIEVRVRVRVKAGLGTLPLDIEENLLRIGREALTNTVKHAHARHVALDVEAGQGRLLLRVQDDGRGFDPGEHADAGGGHFGLLGIRERVDLLGGEFTVASHPGEGTRVVVALPLPAAT